MLKIIFYLCIMLPPLNLAALDKSLLLQDTITDKYTVELRRLYEDWKIGKSNIKGTGKTMPLMLGAIPTLNDDTYIGVWARTEIHSSQENIIRVLRDVSNYSSIYQDLEKVEEIKKENDNSIMDWVFKGPFGTKTNYQTVQNIQTFSPVRSALIYGLKERKKVQAADGIILIQEVNGVSYYFSVDFFNADWGIAKLFTSRIWSETCESTARTTLSIKYLAERSKTDLGIGTHKISAVNVSASDLKNASLICSEMKSHKKQKDFGKLILDTLD